MPKDWLGLFTNISLPSNQVARVFHGSHELRVALHHDLFVVAAQAALQEAQDQLLVVDVVGLHVITKLLDLQQLSDAFDGRRLVERLELGSELPKLHLAPSS